jgi:hypothetical protein
MRRFDTENPTSPALGFAPRPVDLSRHALAHLHLASDQMAVMQD